MVGGLFSGISVPAVAEEVIRLLECLIKCGKSFVGDS
jgi:hypothetical protein